MYVKGEENVKCSVKVISDKQDNLTQKNEVHKKERKFSMKVRQPVKAVLELQKREFY